MSPHDYAQLIDNADLYEVVRKTPLEPAVLLSARLNNEVLLKREDLQPIFSFKLRGALNKLNQLTAAQLANGVICSSAGNHAQGVALAANRRNVKAVIVMPVTTPGIKVAAVRRLGGETILHGDNYDAAYELACEVAAERGLTFIHPFDDPDVIVGQGTIARELCEQWTTPPAAVFVPIGGGGLIGGIASYLKARQPGIRIIGVEAADSASMSAALAAGHPVTLDHVGIFADGVAVRRVGDESFRLCQQLVDEVMTVDTDQTCAAVQDIFEDTRSIVEPAGALAVAGIKKYLQQHPTHDQTYVAIACGANVNFDRLRHIAERAAIGEQREMLMAVEIPEEAGSFLRFCDALGKRSVTEFNYRYADKAKARVFVGVELRRGEVERREVLASIAALGYPVTDLSDNELAKLHVRHMVGGRSPSLSDEHLFRFEFPERPGALAAFLNAIGNRWNISLFHYRNHGSDHGRILAGIQVADDDAAELEAHLQELGYPHSDESANPAYRLFLD